MAASKLFDIRTCLRAATGDVQGVERGRWEEVASHHNVSAKKIKT
jgi:hypothetical protein